MERENLLEYIEVVEDLDVDTEQMTFWCKLLDQHGNLNKRFAKVSNHYIDFNEKKKSEIPAFYEKMENIEAIYINRDRDWLVLKRSELPNIVLKTKHAVEVLRVVYAIRYYDEISVYQVKEEKLK